MKSGSACRTSTATDSSTRMGQDEPRAVFEQPRCGLGQRGLDGGHAPRDDYATARLLTSIVARLPGEARKDRAFEVDAGCRQIMPKCRGASSPPVPRRHGGRLRARQRGVRRPSADCVSRDDRDRGGLTAARRSLAVRAVRLIYRGLKRMTASGPGFSSSSRALLMRCHGRKYVGVAVVRAPIWLWFFSFETFSTRNHNPVGDSPTILPATIHTSEDPVARGPKPKIEKTSSSDSHTASHLPSSSIMAAYLVGRIVCPALAQRPRDQPGRRSRSRRAARPRRRTLPRRI